jgi:hypothetical protein
MNNDPSGNRTPVVHPVASNIYKVLKQIFNIKSVTLGYYKSEKFCYK